ncbi:P-loop containing nucleoside triphosphate hydrolase protein, partial [Mycena galopus ATCC 62051]
FRIMGPTGTGKSSFIERLTGDKSIHIGHGVESASSEIGRYNYFCEDGRCVTFVDFPGFDDSRRGVTDTDILRKIAAFLELEFNQDRELSGIIYFHRITDDRMGGISARNLRMFRKLCGDNALKSVVIVTTRWDDVQEKDRGAMDKREKELMETPGKLFEPVVAAGGQFLRHDNTTGSARRVMEAVLQKEPIVLQIQLEMHDGKTLEETAVGSELAAEMEKLMDGHSSEMKNLKAGMAKAIATKDEASKKELEAERTKMQQQMAKWEKQKKALADGLAAERAGVIKRQQEADRKLREQAAEFDRRVKETEARAKEDQRKLQTTLNDISRERAAAAKKLDDLENSKAKSGRTRRERIQPHIDQVRKEKEAADMKYRALLRSMRAQVNVP